jgi:tetratricopeptide (TPR) repeat protein
MMDGRRVTNDRQTAMLLGASSTAEHELRVVAPDGAARQVHVVALAGRPSTSLADGLQGEIARGPSAAGRLLFAQVSADADRALVVLGDVLARFPNLAEAHAATAQRLLDLGVGRSDASDDRRFLVRAAIDRALAADSDSLAVQITAVGLLASLGDDVGAARHAEAAVRIDDDSANAHYLLGAVRLRMGDAAAALPELHRAAELDPYVPDHYSSLSAAYRAIGLTKQAQESDRALTTLLANGGAVGADSARPTRVLLMSAFAAALGVALSMLRRGRPQAHDAARRRPEIASRPGAVMALEGMAALAVLSIAVPLLSRALDLSAGPKLATDIADHLAPGVILLGVCISGLLRSGRARPSGENVMLALPAGLIGFWMAATHVPLVVDALAGRVRFEVLALHASPGPIVILLAVVLAQSPFRRLVAASTIGRRAAA